MAICDIVTKFQVPLHHILGELTRGGMTEKLKRCNLMRVAVFFLVLMSGLYGCSGIEKVKGALYPSWAGRKAKIMAWAASEKTKVDRGTLKNSEYWKEFYRKSLELRPDLDDFLCYAHEMIKISSIFEEGMITEEQFNDKCRQLSDLLAQEEDRRARMHSLGRVDREARLFTLYRGSLFLDYIDDLREQLNEAGPQYSVNRCAFFGESIQCASHNPPF